jgi:hypothetical protein
MRSDCDKPLCHHGGTVFLPDGELVCSLHYLAWAQALKTTAKPKSATAIHEEMNRRPRKT